MNNTPTPREEFEEWLETFYDNSNILSPRSLAWEAWQVAQKEATEQRDRLAEALTEAVTLAVNEPDLLIGYFVSEDSPIRQFLQSLNQNEL